MFWIFFIESDPYERFVINKLISLELKLNSIERCQKLILKKISIDTFEAKEKETIDIYQDLPLKTETDLQSMENKLNNDSLYRNEMVSWMSCVFRRYKMKSYTKIRKGSSKFKNNNIKRLMRATQLLMNVK